MSRCRRRISLPFGTLFQQLFFRFRIFVQVAEEREKSARLCKNVRTMQEFNAALGDLDAAFTVGIPPDAV